MLCLVAQLCLTICDPMDCSPPGSFVHEDAPGKNMQWVAMPSSRGSSQPRVQTQVSHITGRFFTIEPRGKPTVRLTCKNICLIIFVKSVIKNVTAIYSSLLPNSISIQNHIILLIILDIACIFGYWKSFKMAIKNTKCEECPI